MLLAGDEFGRTQQGNNNAYCQDNEISWVDWDAIGDDGRALTAFVRQADRCCATRFPILRRGRFLTGEYNEELGVKDVTWINAAGTEMERGAVGGRQHALLRHAARRPRAGDRHQAAAARTRRCSCV